MDDRRPTYGVRTRHASCRSPVQTPAGRHGAHISYSTIPNAHMSTLLVYPVPILSGRICSVWERIRHRHRQKPTCTKHTSGAEYDRVPQIVCMNFLSPASCRASPKSASCGGSPHSGRTHRTLPQHLHDYFPSRAPVEEHILRLDISVHNFGAARRTTTISGRHSTHSQPAYWCKYDNVRSKRREATMAAGSARAPFAVTRITQVQPEVWPG